MKAGGKQRAFICLLPIVLLLTGSVRAQQPSKMYRIGVLSNALHSTPGVLPLWDAFRQELHERGWIEGQNIVIEYRFAEGHAERFPVLAAELVRHSVDIIVAVSSLGARAAKDATRTIPIVMIYVFDPIEQGLVASLARPGNNITGVTFVAGSEIVGKELELLKEAVPKVSHVAALLNPGSGGNSAILKETQVAAQALALKLQIVEVRSANELKSAFDAINKGHAGALLVLPHPFTFAYAKQIVDLAAKNRVPAMYSFRESAEAGGLMAYAADTLEMFRRAAAPLDYQSSGNGLNEIGETRCSVGS